MGEDRRDAEDVQQQAADVACADCREHLDSPDSSHREAVEMTIAEINRRIRIAAILSNLSDFDRQEVEDYINDGLETNEDHLESAIRLLASMRGDLNEKIANFQFDLHHVQQRMLK